MFLETAYYEDNRLGLGELGLAPGQKAAKGTSFVGGVASTAAPFAIAGPVGAAIGAAVGIVSGIVASIFGAHAKKVAAEDEATGAWAASGPQSIEATMAAWRGGRISSSDALASLQSIEQQYVANMSGVSKYKGKFGVLPDPNAPRPSNNCNASCGMYWDMMQQMKAYKAEIAGGGGGLSSIFGGGGGIAGIPLPLLIVGGLLIFGKKLL
jgi:hypothetical protein